MTLYICIDTHLILFIVANFQVRLIHLPEPDSTSNLQILQNPFSELNLRMQLQSRDGVLSPCIYY